MRAGVSAIAVHLSVFSAQRSGCQTGEAIMKKALQSLVILIGFLYGWRQGVPLSPAAASGSASALVLSLSHLLNPRRESIRVVLALLSLTLAMIAALVLFVGPG